jgi:putative ABC transport system permease protein
MAQRNLQRAKIRTVLAVVTVAVGVLAVGGLGIFGLAFEEKQRQNLGDIANEVRVEAPGQSAFSFQTDDPPELDERRLALIREVANDSELTIIRQVERRQTQVGEEITAPTRVVGVTNPTATYDVVRGEIPERWDSGVVVDALSASVFDLDIGDPVEVDGRLQEVIAIVAEPRGQFSVERTGSAALVPLDLVRTADTPYRGVVIHAPDSFEAEEIATELQTKLNGPLRNDKSEFDISARQEEIEQIDQQFTSTNTFLVGVGSISLLIAGISIGNLQLMSARERREEIGVLRAIGYSRLDILGIMLIESVILGLLAAVLGSGMTVGAGILINQRLLAEPLAFQPNTAVYLGSAFGFGIVICILAGLYPAWRASRERPVNALRG